MSLLGNRAAFQESPNKWATFRCLKCQHVEKQLPSVKGVYHRCPVTKTVRELKREG